MHQSHKQQYVVKYSHKFRISWYTGLKISWRIRVTYYEILHRTLLSYTVVLKSSLNYSTIKIILRLLKGKTHLYMWNQPKCHNQSHEQWYEKNYPHMFNKFPDILKSRLLTYMCYKQKKHTTLDMFHSCVPAAEFTILIDQRGPVWSHVVKMPVIYTPLKFLCILCNA